MADPFAPCETTGLPLKDPLWIKLWNLDMQVQGCQKITLRCAKWG